MLSSVKEILTREVNIKEFLEMEIEVKRLKELLETEIKLKEFLVQEIDIRSLLSSKGQKNAAKIVKIDAIKDAEGILAQAAAKPVKKLLPPFDYSLIDSLRKDHKEILFVYNEMMKYAEAKDYPKVSGRLELFSRKIREHYQKADVDLYAYLKCHIQQKYPKRDKAFTELSLQMKNISIEIFFTISQSTNIPINDKNYDGFMRELSQLGEQLNMRIDREESVLFMMYKKCNEALDIS